MAKLQHKDQIQYSTNYSVKATFIQRKKKYKNVNNFVIWKYADSSIWSALSNDRFLSFQLSLQSTSILRSSAVSFCSIVFKHVHSSVWTSSSCCLRSELWLRPCLLKEETNKLQHDNASVCYNDRARIHVQLLEFCVKNSFACHLNTRDLRTYILMYATMMTAKRMTAPVDVISMTFAIKKKQKNKNKQNYQTWPKLHLNIK